MSIREMDTDAILALADSLEQDGTIEVACGSGVRMLRHIAELRLKVSETHERELRLSWALDNRISVVRATDRKFYAHKHPLNPSRIVGSGSLPSIAIDAAREASETQ